MCPGRKRVFSKLLMNCEKLITCLFCNAGGCWGSAETRFVLVHTQSRNTHLVVLQNPAVLIRLKVATYVRINHVNCFNAQTFLSGILERHFLKPFFLLSTELRRLVRPCPAGGDRQGCWQAEFYSLMGEELGVPHGQSDG